MFNSTQFAPWLVGGVIALSLTLYATWALFGDRARGQRRCLKGSKEPVVRARATRSRSPAVGPHMVRPTRSRVAYQMD